MKIIILIIILILIYYSINIINFFFKFLVGGYDLVVNNNNNNDIQPFYFIHIPKNMGTLIHYHLPKTYNNKYYLFGYLNNKLLFTMRNHMLLDNLIKYDPILLNLPMIAIIRDPIPRFISICNFTRINPKYLIVLCKRFGHTTFPNIHNLYNSILPQVKFITSQHNLNIHLFKITDKKNIKTAFLNYEIDIDFNKKINESNKKYSIDNLEKEDMKFLNEYYKEDLELYSRIPNGGIKIIKYT